MPLHNKNKRSLLTHLRDIKNTATLNIGTLLFSALFIYIVISLIIYLTATHIVSYQVTSGVLSKNPSYTALILREEQLVSSTTSGSTTYYTKDSSKVQQNGAVFGVGSSQASSDTAMTLSDEQLSKIRSSLATFSNYFDSNNFSDVYSYKYQLEGSVVNEYVAESSASNTDNSSSDSDSDSSTTVTTQTIGNQTVNFAPSDGLVLYSSDGYEEVTEENLSASDFSRSSYESTNLRKDTIEVGDTAYRLITSEKWSIYIPLSEEQVVALAGKDTIKVRFHKDNMNQTGKFTLISNDSGYYAKISFSSGMIRYASDRFLKVELVTNTQTGLKIPLSSLVDKDFYIIPKEYATVGGSSNETGFNKKTSGDSTEFINATIYDSDDDYYYVDQDDFDKNDVLLKPNSTEQYKVSETKSLKGVYCINKGYAVFRKVNIIDQNEEYCIVESGTTYGISQYDNIVEDSSTVKEEEVLY